MYIACASCHIACTSCYIPRFTTVYFNTGTGRLDMSLSICEKPRRSCCSRPSINLLIASSWLSASGTPKNSSSSGHGWGFPHLGHWKAVCPQGLPGSLCASSCAARNPANIPVYIKMIYVYTMHILVCVWYMLWIYKYTSIYVYIHGIYHEHHSIYHEHHSISNVFLAERDAIVHEWSKSLNFQFTCNVQRCPDDVEFLGRYAMRVISIKHFGR